MNKFQYAVTPNGQKPVYIFAHSEIDALNRYARNRRFNDFEDAVIRGGWCGTNFTVYEVEKSSSGPPVPIQQEDDFLPNGVDGYDLYLEQQAEAATYRAGYWGPYEF
jgi:hypothetical protein